MTVPSTVARAVIAAIREQYPDPGVQVLVMIAVPMPGTEVEVGEYVEKDFIFGMGLEARSQEVALELVGEAEKVIRENPNGVGPRP